MQNRKIYLLLFAALAMVQLYVPVQMILSKESIKSQGTAYKFKVAPLDPNDPFRGKYIRLDFEIDRYNDSNNALDLPDLPYNEDRTAYALLGVNDHGFAVLSDISLEKPEAINYVEVKARYFFKHDSLSRKGRRVHVDFPFERFYMDENKAPKAERLQQELRLDSNSVTYARVFIYKGESVLDDVLVDGVSISEMVENLSESKD